MHRTNAGILLEQMLHDWKQRYLLCWAGENDSPEWGGAYDCGCCLTYVGGDALQTELGRCRCVCHQRIERMVSNPDLRMFVLALAASDEFPFVPKDYEDMLQHERGIKQEHDKWREDGAPGVQGECCESCQFIRRHEARMASEAAQKIEQAPKDAELITFAGCLRCGKAIGTGNHPCTCPPPDTPVPECERCYEEDGSLTCIRGAHATEVLAKNK